MDTQSKYSKNVREFRRLRAIELFESGMKPIRIAEAVGVTRGAVSQWLKLYREKGKDALRHKKHSKKPCRLSPEQKSELLSYLAQGAEAFGYEGQIWTQARVCALIKMKFGITYTVKYMGQLLRKLR